MELFARLDLDSEQAKTRRDELETLVDGMLALHRRLDDAGDGRENEKIQAAIQQTDQAIDRLVYQLYGLNEKEIHIIRTAMMDNKN